MTQDSDVRGLAREVARGLVARGTAQEELSFTVTRMEERATGFLGLKKKQIGVHDSVVKPFGWRVWWQHLEQILWQLGPENIQEDTTYGELWLRPDGSIEYLWIEHMNHPGSGTQTREIKGEHAATAQELAAADHHWEQHEVPASGAQRRRHAWQPSSAAAHTTLRQVLESLRAA